MLEVHLYVESKLLAKYTDMLIIKQSFPWKGQVRDLVDSAKLKSCVGGSSESEISAHFEKDVYGPKETIKIQTAINNSQCSHSISNLHTTLF